MKFLPLLHCNGRLVLELLLMAVVAPALGQTQSAPATTQTPATGATPTVAANQTNGPAAPAAEGNAGTGKQLFNTMLGCSHCHGVNSVGHTDNRNLREIRKRRSGEWEAVFAQVMKEGRAGTAMPPWTHLTTKQVADIKAYILSIREE